MKDEVVPWRLEQILANMEYGTPPPGGSGAAVVPAAAVAQKESETVALKKIDEGIKVALGEFVIRKERSELRIGEEIILLEEAVDALRKGASFDMVLNRLPPLSRARYILLMRKKNFPVQIIIKMMLKDLSFLRSIKKKLAMFTGEDLMGMLKALRALQKK
jgi:hypothetical protein